MTFRQLLLSLCAYATAFALAWCVTWVMCELHPAADTARQTASTYVVPPSGGLCGESANRITPPP